MEKKIIEELKQKLKQLGVPKELLENPAVLERFKIELKDNRTKGDLTFIVSEDGYTLGKYDESSNHLTRFVKFDKDCRKFNASYTSYSTGNNFSDVEESALFDENGILQKYTMSYTSNGSLDGGLAGGNTYEADGKGYIHSDSGKDSYIDFGFLSAQDLTKYGILSKKSYFNDKKISLTEALEKFKMYSNLVLNKYPNLREFYEGKETEVINVITEECLANQNSLIIATTDELKSVGVTDRELELSQKLFEKQEQIDTLEKCNKKLQRQLEETLSFADKVRKSPFGKIFFRKQLPQLPDGKDDNVR